MPLNDIDLTKLAGDVEGSFKKWAVPYLMSMLIAVPGFGWLGLPIISTLAAAAIGAVINILAKSLIMQAFFLNTTIRKATQANDYVNALKIKKNLPVTSTEEEFKNAELHEMDAFRAFVAAH